MWKKLVSAALALTLVLTCVACGDTKNSDGSNKKSDSSGLRIPFGEQHICAEMSGMPHYVDRPFTGGDGPPRQ